MLQFGCVRKKVRNSELKVRQSFRCAKVLLWMRTIIVHCYIQKIVRFPQSASPSVWNENGFQCCKILRRGRPGIMPWPAAQYPLQWVLFRLQCLQYTSVLVLVEVFFSYQLLWCRPKLSTYSYLCVPRCIFSSLRGQHSLLQRHFCGRVEFPKRDNALMLYLKSSLALSALVAVRSICHSCGGRDRPGV